MKTKTLYVTIVMFIVALCSIKWCNNGSQVAVDYGLLEVERVDSEKPDTYSKFVNCRLGSGTGMSCVEVITMSGDTMLLNKVSEFTGREADIIGSLSNDPSMVYDMLVTDNGNALDVAVNMTELRASWTNEGQGFALGADSTAWALGNSTLVYNHWRLDRNRLLLRRTMKLEGGVTEVVDTMRMVYLDADTLELVNNLGETIKYSHPN